MTTEVKNYLNKQPMPTYSKGEERFNLITHICGGGIGVIMLVISLVLASINNLGFEAILSLIIYGISTIGLYTMSSVYHGLSKKLIGKKIFRIIDHCTIYLLIAGTYTPICIIALNNTVEGMIILIGEWTLCILGVVLNALWLNKKPVIIISIFLYILTGWGLMFVPSAISLLTLKEFILILIGGVMYTIGVVFYGLGKKKKWSHSIFHIFCVLGTVIQFLGIILIITR